MQKATWAAAFWRVRWDFRAALWANSGCADHCGRVAHALPLFLLRKMLSEVTPGLQQLNREAHPRLQRRAGRLQVDLVRPRRLKRPVRPTKHPQPTWFNPF